MLPKLRRRQRLKVGVAVCRRIVRQRCRQHVTCALIRNVKETQEQLELRKQVPMVPVELRVGDAFLLLRLAKPTLQLLNTLPNEPMKCRRFPLSRWIKGIGVRWPLFGHLLMNPSFEPHIVWGGWWWRRGTVLKSGVQRLS